MKKFVEYCDEFFNTKIDLDLPFRENDIDELDLMMLVVDLEEGYGVDIDDDQVEQIVCLRDLFNMIEENKCKRI